MTDEQMQFELPDLPTIPDQHAIPYEAIRYVAGYTKMYVQEYAKAYATAAILADRERRAAKDAGAGDEPWIAELRPLVEAAIAERLEAASHPFKLAFGANDWRLVSILWPRLDRVIDALSSTPPAPAAPVSVAVREYARQLVERFENAARNCGNWHGMYQGKPMPHDVYEQFSSVRDRTIPELRAELLAALAATQQAEPSAKDDNPWLPHNGGPCPVRPIVRVDVKLRNGEIIIDRVALSLFWIHFDAAKDIIEYRLHREGNKS